MSKSIFKKWGGKIMARAIDDLLDMVEQSGHGPKKAPDGESRDEFLARIGPLDRREVSEGRKVTLHCSCPGRGGNRHWRVVASNPDAIELHLAEESLWAAGPAPSKRS